MDPKQFETDWVELGREICQKIYTNPDAQKIKASLRKNGSLNMEEQTQFITICNRIKYDVIYSKVGPEGSQGYKQFSADWSRWFEEKGVGSSRNRGQRNSVEHILFGSTPDPAQFLLHFEEEMLGSMKE